VAEFGESLADGPEAGVEVAPALDGGPHGVRPSSRQRWTQYGPWSRPLAQRQPGLPQRFHSGCRLPGKALLGNKSSKFICLALRSRSLRDRGARFSIGTAEVSHGRIRSIQYVVGVV
jgi:hypothetical protein